MSDELEEARARIAELEAAAKVERERMLKRRAANRARRAKEREAAARVPKKRRGNGGHHARRVLDRAKVIEALHEAMGNVTGAAELLTKWRIEESDARRARREAENPELPAETADEHEARHAECRVPRRTVQDYVNQLPDCGKAREEAFKDAISLARDVVHSHLRKGSLIAARYVLDRRDPAFAPRSKVTLETPAGEPLDAGFLTEDERAKVLEETEGAEERR